MQAEGWQERVNFWRIRHREALAEFYGERNSTTFADLLAGTFLLVLMGTALSAQVILSDQNQGDSFSSAFGW